MPILGAAVVLGSTCALPSTALAAGTDHHIDCGTGDDAADGLTQATAWRSLERAVGAPIAPGDRVLLRAGCRWDGPMYTTWSGTADAPIVIGRYGDGPPPVIEDASVQIEVRGAHVHLEGLHLRADPPTTDPTCDDWPAGRTFGAIFEDGAHDGEIRDSLVEGLFMGVRVAPGADHIRIIGNRFVDNHVKSEDPLSDSGALAIDLQGDDNEVAWNTISGSAACSRLYAGWDGSAISVYGGQRNVIHHNRSFANQDFVEIGHPRSRDTLIAYNTDVSDLPIANFLVVHGEGSDFGPTMGTRAFHNTAVLTGGGEVVACAGTIGPGGLELRANVLWGEGAVATCDAAIVEGENVYWRSDGFPVVTYPIDGSSLVADPRLVDPLDGDLRLTRGSPAIDGASSMDLDLGGGVDAAGVVVPQGSAPDIGAFEWSAEAPPSPGSGSGNVVGPAGPPSIGAPTGGPLERPLIPRGTLELLAMVAASFAAGLSVREVARNRRR